MTSPARTSRCDEIVSLIDACLDEMAPPHPGSGQNADASDAFELGAVEQGLHALSQRVRSHLSLGRSGAAR